MHTNLSEIKERLQSEIKTYEIGTRTRGRTLERKRITGKLNIGKVKYIKVYETVLNYGSGGYTPIHWLVFECFVDGEDERKGFRMKTTGNNFNEVFDKMLDKIGLFIKETHATIPIA